jgi:putative tryptophan/tyrosine transport system substrate-binding protein
MILRREFIALLGGAAAAWPLAARAQHPTMPVVGFLSGRSLASDAELVAVFRRALGESGFVEARSSSAGRTGGSINCRRWRPS